MASHPRLPTMSQLANGDSDRTFTPQTMQHRKHCRICNGQRNTRMLLGASLHVLREKGIFKNEAEVEKGSKVVCSTCRVKLKRIISYTNKIEELKGKIVGLVAELKELANCDDVEIIEDNSEEIFPDDKQSENQEEYLNGELKFSSDFTAEDVVMKFEEVPELENDKDPLTNQTNCPEAVVFKCEFEPEDVELMPTQLYNSVDSSQLFQMPPTPQPHGTGFIDSRVICHECNVYFPNNISLGRHFKYSPKHASEESIKTCDTCAIIFPSLSKRIDHDRANHLEMFWGLKTNITLKETIKCGACAKEFYSEYGYNKHLKSEVTIYGCEGGLSCGQCGAVFRTFEERRSHGCEADVVEPEKRAREIEGDECNGVVDLKRVKCEEESTEGGHRVEVKIEKTND